MTPVDQEYLYVEEPRQYGDCVRAVIASLLDLPIADVPHFLKEANGDHYEFYCAIDDFLASRCLKIMWQVSLIHYWRPGDPDLYHYMSGPSPRDKNIHHAVVGMNGNIVFDPHPDHTGLAGTPSQWRNAVIVKI